MINCRFFRVLLPLFMLFSLLPAFGSAASSGTVDSGTVGAGPLDESTRE